MKPKKPSGLNTYVITVSRVFPVTHSRKGQETKFEELIKEGLKTHTIRGNYPLWSKRLDEVNAGKAVLSIRVWRGRPYWPSEDGGPAQREILQLTSVKYEHAVVTSEFVLANGDPLDIPTVSRRDGLSPSDFFEWFGMHTEKARIEGKTFEGTIIHFSGDTYTK